MFTLCALGSARCISLSESHFFFKECYNFLCSFSLQVVRVAEEAAGTIAKSLVPRLCLQALSPVLREAEFPVNLAALKMAVKVLLDSIACFLSRGCHVVQLIQKKKKDWIELLLFHV